MADLPVFTYQTRIHLQPPQNEALEAYAELYGKAERTLFAATQTGIDAMDLKQEYLLLFGITARQFNAIRIGLKGKVRSIEELRPQQIAEAEVRIRKAEKLIARLEKTRPGSEKLHQKKRRLVGLFQRLKAMKDDQAAGTVRICFGSRKLFRAQFALEANGYKDHSDWKADWLKSRSSQFFVLGSKDETEGNQSCQAKVEENGTLTLTLRLPNALSETQGKFLVIPGVKFAYGHDAILAALASSARVEATTATQKKIVKRTGTALSYRFVRDTKGWRVFVSLEAQPIEKATRSQAGAIGIDLNADHLAFAETDGFGNLIDFRRFDCAVYGKTEEQATAIIGDAAARIAERAKLAGKPVLIEELDFQNKKAELESADRRAARMLSSFAFNKTAASIKSACFRAGVEVVEVNPAYTSVIGAVNYARSKGIPTHQGAAYAIARRGLGMSERPTCRVAVVPARKGGHVTFALPVRNRAKHVWSFWSNVKTRLKAAHQAHFRCGAHKKAPPPLPRPNPAACATGSPRRDSVASIALSTVR
jgi:IS605 OrfB family transposase